MHHSKHLSKWKYANECRASNSVAHPPSHPPLRSPGITADLSPQRETLHSGKPAWNKHPNNESMRFFLPAEHNDTQPISYRLGPIFRVVVLVPSTSSIHCSLFATTFAIIYYFTKLLPRCIAGSLFVSVIRYTYFRAVIFWFSFWLLFPVRFGLVWSLHCCSVLWGEKRNSKEREKDYSRLLSGIAKSRVHICTWGWDL